MSRTGNPNQMFFHEKLKHLRLGFAYTLKEVSKGTGLSLTYISGVEHGKVNPSFETICKFANFYNMKLERLLKGVKSEPDKYSVCDSSTE